MKIIRYIIVFMLFAFVYGCNKNTEVVITFETNGGNEMSVIVVNDATILTIPDPMKEGFIFDGWFLDEDLTLPFSLKSYDFKTSIKLYAKWKTLSFTISFDSQGGSTVNDIILDPGLEIVEPTSPVMDGYIFSGWYLDVEDVEAYVFDVMPNHNFTLYADWASVGLSYELINDGQAYEVSIGDAIEIENVKIPKTYLGKPVTKIADQGFQYAEDMNELLIPTSITHIGSFAFAYASLLSSVLLPKSIETIGMSVFGYCYALESIDVDPRNLHFSSIDGVLFTKNMETLIRYPEAKTNTSYTVPNQVLVIGEYAFLYSQNLTSIDLGSSVTTIKSHAFFGCSGLTSIDIPNQVTEIELYAFRSCSGLASVNIGTGLTEISSYMFYGCTGLTSIVLPVNIAAIRYGAFYDCYHLSSVTILRPSTMGIVTPGFFIFTNTASNLKIYLVDQNTYNAYYADSSWISYKSRLLVM